MACVNNPWKHSREKNCVGKSVRVTRDNVRLIPTIKVQLLAGDALRCTRVRVIRWVEVV